MKLAAGVSVFGLLCCLSLQHDLHVARATAQLTPSGQLSTVMIDIDEEPEVVEESADATLAVRNRNPLNVKARKADPRKGQIGVDKYGHAIFESYEYGVRAAALTLRSYARRHQIATVQELVERFAEGNHAGYIAHICKVLKVKPKEEIDLVKRMPELLRVMARHESGQTLPETLFIPYDVVAKL